MKLRRYLGSLRVLPVLCVAAVIALPPSMPAAYAADEPPPLDTQKAGMDEPAAAKTGAASAVPPAFDQFRGIIAKGVLRHPALAVINSQTEEHEQDVAVAYSAFLPQVNGGPSIVNHRAVPPVVVGLQDRRIDAGVTASQLIYDFGAAHDRWNSAKLQVQASKQELQGVSNTYALKAIQTYLDVIRYRRLEEAYGQYAVQMQTLLDAVKLRASSGVGSEADTLRAESRMSEASIKVSVYTAMRQRAEAQYREIFDEPAGALALPQLRIAEVEDATPDTLVGDALKNNPTLIRQKLLTDSAKAEAEAAKEDLWPKVRLDASATKYSVVGAASTNYNNDVDVEMHFIYSLYTGGADTARTHLSVAKYHEQIYETDVATRELERDVRLAIADLQNASRRVESLRQAQSADNNAVTAYREEFKANRVKFIEILDAQRDANSSVTQLIDGEIDLEQSKYNVMALTGGLLPFFDLNNPKASEQPSNSIWPWK